MSYKWERDCWTSVLAVTNLFCEEESAPAQVGGGTEPDAVLSQLCTDQLENQHNGCTKYIVLYKYRCVCVPLGCTCTRVSVCVCVCVVWLLLFLYNCTNLRRALVLKKKQRAR